MVALYGVAALLLEVLFWAIFLRAILSWFRPAEYRRWYVELVTVLERITEPILGPIRDRLPPYRTGMIDFSPFVAMILINLVKQLLARLLL